MYHLCYVIIFSRWLGPFSISPIIVLILFITRWLT